ncbi:hypothetical protein J3458_002689 [Metarhizium acridum]|uniref:uncharacterized protein n=1 Tax=Metarhizium acridum TaxID=92637 RepID=UPI001C6B6438|nr:hypothetical protein J3458_002689 [Metarhizium acridum]
MGKCDWATVRSIAKDASKLKKLRSKGYLDQLLVLAVRRNDVEVATDLLKNGWSKLQRPSILHIAASMGNTDLVTELMNYIPPLCTVDAFGMLPAHRAAERGHRRIAQLIFMGSDKDARDQWPIFMVCEGVSPSTIEFLLRFGFGPQCSDKRKRTPLHIASSTGATDMFGNFCSRGQTGRCKVTRELRHFMLRHLEVGPV